MTYTELHLHSCWSLLEGASTPEELVMRAVELGYDTLALTDHDGLYGAMEFAQVCKANGIRPITGAELTLAPHPPPAGNQEPELGTRDATGTRAQKGKATTSLSSPPTAAATATSAGSSPTPTPTTGSAPPSTRRCWRSTPGV